MKLTIYCDEDSFSLDYTEIQFVKPEEVIAKEFSNGEELTFLLKGLVNKVTGCPIT